MSESALWNELRPYFDGAGHATRVENHEAGPGIPDVDYCFDGDEGHVELKFTNNVKKGVRFRDTQYRWFKHRVQAGGRPCVLVKVWIDRWPVYYFYYGNTIVDMHAHRHTSIQYWADRANRWWEHKLDIEQLIWELREQSVSSR